MSNLVNNPDFSSGVEHWEASDGFRWDFTEQGLKVTVLEKNASVFLVQEIFLKKGSYFFRAEISTESRFLVEVIESQSGAAIKAAIQNNGSQSATEFRFEVTGDLEAAIRISFVKTQVNGNLFIKYICIHQNGESSSPYLNAPTKTFWGGTVAKNSYFDLNELSKHQAVLDGNYKYATAGSCFAQHISRHLKEKGLACLDLESPPSELSKEEVSAFGYNQFSCRYGNIYTTRQLYQLFLESENRFRHGDVIWCKNGRFYDALRPSVDPVGYRRPEFVKAQREIHLQQVAKLWRSFDVFVFTLGLTECWVSKEFGTVYPTAPGTIAGCFDPLKYEFINFGYDQIYSDLNSFWNEIKKINPSAKILLTVSPVPLTATAADEHVLVATVYSKSVLRAVAGEFVKNSPDAYYFPSFEIINSHPSRGIFYDPNLRTVNKAGVDFVMRHFFSDKSIDGLKSNKFLSISDSESEVGSEVEFEVHCDDELLDKFCAHQGVGKSN